MKNLSPPSENMNSEKHTVSLERWPSPHLLEITGLAADSVCLTSQPLDFREQVNVYHLFFVSYQRVGIQGAVACA